jgi:hypothetical protein
MAVYLAFNSRAECIRCGSELHSGGRITHGSQVLKVTERVACVKVSKERKTTKNREHQVEDQSVSQLCCREREGKRWESTSETHP